MILNRIYELHGARVLEYGEQHPVIHTPQNAVDLIGEALREAPA